MSSFSPAESSPLLGAVGPPPRTDHGAGDAEQEDAITEALLANEARSSNFRASRKWDTLAASMTEISLLAMAIYTIYLVARQDNPIQTLRFFVPHPPLQILSTLVLFSGVLALQPTTASRQKEKGRRRRAHIGIQITAALLLLVGAAFMVYNKVDHGAEHFTTWHGRIGLFTLCFIIVHLLLGAASVFLQGPVFGGETNAKAFWKWHRVLGYLVLLFLTLTIHLAGFYSDWVVRASGSGKIGRIMIYILCPLLALVGITIRVRLSKLPQYGTQ